MTSDAKIGLLLGLVFIFVIAFIINGLPNLRPQTSKGEVSTTMVPAADENFGVADNAQKAQETLDWTDLPDRRQATSDVTGSAAVPEPGATVGQPQTADNQSVRSVFPVPSIENLLEYLTPAVQQREQSSNVIMDTPKQPAEQATVTPQPVARATQTREASKPSGAPATRNKPAETTYVVADGENLASVAKKVYGPEEGNRIVNVQRIFEANKDVLKSIDEVRSGQKLVIPPLPQASVKKDTPADVLPKTLFEKVDSIRKQAQANLPPKAPEVRWYVVQDGDNLWKIATSQLGSGPRWEEIAKLNADVLESSEKLDVGMKIRLPAK
jgi:nucleoid-associated protein YgaU